MKALLQLGVSLVLLRRTLLGSTDANQDGDGSCMMIDERCDGYGCEGDTTTWFWD